MAYLPPTYSPFSTSTTSTTTTTAFATASFAVKTNQPPHLRHRSRRNAKPRPKPKPSRRVRQPHAFLNTPTLPPPTSEPPVEPFDSSVEHFFTTYQFNQLLRPLVRRKNSLPRCKLLFERLLSLSLTPDKYTFSLMFTSCIASNDPAYAHHLQSLLHTYNVPLDNHLRSNLLTLAANATPPRIDQCIHIFRSAKEPSRIMCNIIMDAFARAGRVDDCLNTYRYMSLRGIVADRYTVSAIIRAYVKVDRLEEAVEALKKMYCAGLAITPPAFGMIISAYGRQRRLTEAIAIFDQMTRFGVPPTQVTYNILIAACADAEDVEKAFDVYHEMRYTSSFPGDRYTYHSLMRCCLRTGHPTRALALYRDIQETPFQCNQVSYRFAFQAAGQALDLDALHSMHSDMENSTLVPRADTVGMLIAAAIRCSDLEAALQFFSCYGDQHVFPHIITGLREMDNGENDFAGTEKVVHELERSWRRRQKITS